MNLNVLTGRVRDHRGDAEAIHADDPGVEVAIDMAGPWLLVHVSRRSLFRWRCSKLCVRCMSTAVLANHLL